MIPGTYPLYEKRAEHCRTIHGSTVRYETICRDLPVRGDDGAVVGTAFSYEYLRTDCGDPGNRPVIFAYNGGPGASAVWLHAGLLAPVRFVVKELEEPDYQGEAKLEENPCCLLDQCDLVLLDPPGVGYGTLADGACAKQVFGYEQDAKCIAQVIEDWLTEHDRLHAPVYLLGESYGTVRNCLVADILTGGPFIPGAMSKAIPVAGIMMLGSVVCSDPTELFFGEKEVSATALALPTMAAIHRYHSGRKAPAGQETPVMERGELTGVNPGEKAPAGQEAPEECVSRTYTFVENTYLRAAYLGSRMGSKEREEVIREMSSLTGMPEAYIRNHNLRLDAGEFRNRLLEEEGRIVSAYDGRMTLAYTDRKLDAYADDAVLGPYGYLARNAFDRICREEFQMDLKRPFSAVDFAANGMWDYSGTAKATPFESLSRCLRRNRSLRVLFANGIYDLSTMIGQAAYAAAQFTAVHPGQILVREYPAGHMAYIGSESAERLGRDLRAFTADGAGAGERR